MVESDRPQVTIWRMLIAAAYIRLQTQSEYVILTAIPLQIYLYERASVLPQRCTVGLVVIYVGKN
jgi:hypothetical protein